MYSRIRDKSADIDPGVGHVRRHFPHKIVLDALAQRHVLVVVQISEMRKAGEIA
ncbi:MAG: hypothetical protein JXB07_09195 [Anaerolineae bacterium]|nr:hypothetical protein [Anaerolineae bacterium]